MQKDGVAVTATLQPIAQFVVCVSAYKRPAPPLRFFSVEQGMFAVLLADSQRCLVGKKSFI